MEKAIVNNLIKRDLPVVYKEMALEKAQKIGAMGVFGLKYGEMVHPVKPFAESKRKSGILFNRVKVYTIADYDNVFSREICGGPHVNKTGELGVFKITKEESSSAGVRRIKAILE